MLQSILSNLDGARDVTNSSSAIKPIDALPTQQARETFSNLQNTQVIQTPDFMAGTPSITDIIGNTVGAKQAATPTTVQASPEKDNTASLLNGDKGGDNKYSDNSSQVPALDQDAFEDVPETGVSLVENFKKLKTSYKTTKETLKAAEARTKELEQKLKDYDTGASVPSVIQDLENKVALSQKWEKLHNLKMSDEYAEEFVKPLDESKRRLSVLAEEYGLDIDDMEHAINLKSERDLNGFLSDKFDSIGAMEVKQLITKSRDIMTRAQAAEQEPAAVMQRLHEENTVRLAAADVARKSKITAVAKSAWREAVDDLHPVEFQRVITRRQARRIEPQGRRFAGVQQRPPVGIDRFELHILGTRYRQRHLFADEVCSAVHRQFNRGFGRRVFGGRLLGVQDGGSKNGECGHSLCDLSNYVDHDSSHV